MDAYNPAFSFRKFNDLLRFSGSTGEKLQLLVSDQLLFAKEQPYIIDVSTESYVFANCSLDLYYLIADDMSCFSVEEVTPIPYLQQIKNLRKNITDFAEIQLHNQSSLKNTLQEMASMYRYYVGLTELNLSETAAREKAGLSNEHLFKLAYHAATQNKIPTYLYQCLYPPDETCQYLQLIPIVFNKLLDKLLGIMPTHILIC